MQTTNDRHVRTLSELTDAARLVEAVLYLENESVPLERLGRMTGLSLEQVELAVRQLADHFAQHHHGLDVVVEKQSVKLVPCQDLHEGLRAAYGRKVDKRLSKAALETLSIIAYAQPITRREVENIRGVDCDAIVRILRDRDYVKIVGRKDVPGRPSLFGTTRKFLFEFNLPSISALPQLSDLYKARFIREEELSDED